MNDFTWKALLKKQAGQLHQNSGEALLFCCESGFLVTSFVHRSHPMRRLLGAILDLPRGCRVALVIGERGSGKRRVASRLHQRWGGHGKIVVVDGQLPHTRHVRRFSLLSTVRFQSRGLLLLANVDGLGPEELRDILHTHLVRLGEPNGWGLVATTSDRDSLVRLDADYCTPNLRQAPVLVMPPLRERRADMPQLARELLRLACDDVKQNRKTISSEALDALAAYIWPENVTELTNALDHAVLAASGRSRIELAHLPRVIRGSPEVVAADPSAWPSLADVEKKWIIRSLQHCGGSRALTAAALGIHVNTLGRKLREFGIGRTRSSGRSRPDGS